MQNLQGHHNFIYLYFFPKGFVFSLIFCNCAHARCEFIIQIMLHIWLGGRQFFVIICGMCSLHKRRDIKFISNHNIVMTEKEKEKEQDILAEIFYINEDIMIFLVFISSFSLYTMKMWFYSCLLRKKLREKWK